MLAHQREAKIVELVRREGSVSAADLASTLDVSTATIRRDLDRLESLGRLARVHGGACYKDDPEDPFGSVVNEDIEEKDRIAAAAAQIITDGDVVLLDIGTTTVRIAHNLRGRPLTVMTSSLAVFDVLRHDDAVELVLLGGNVRRNYQTLVGPITEEALTMIHVTTAFLSCTGVRPDGVIVDDISQEATIKRAMAAAADQVALVATRAKFPGKGSLRIGTVAQMDYLVTTAPPEATRELMTKPGGRIIHA